MKRGRSLGDFIVMDCALLTRMSGLPPAYNLRELRDRIGVCSDQVLYHHFCETSLRATFDDPEYRNDFAVWARKNLADNVLAERLGIIDPYESESVATLRQMVLEILEVRLSELSPWVPTVRPGGEFYFMEAVTVAFQTSERVRRPSEMAEAIRHMTNGSLYFHFLEGLRRPPLHTDDFSAWLLEYGPEGEPYARALAGIDFYFKSLPALRDELGHALLVVTQKEAVS
jgi:hypothetical protein